MGQFIVNSNGFSSNNARIQSNAGGSSDQYNLYLQGTIAYPTGNLASIGDSTIITCNGTANNAYGINSQPNFHTASGVSATWGHYILPTFTGTGANTTSYGIEVDNISLSANSTGPKWAYGAYFKTPKYGNSANISLCADDLSIGYYNTTPPSLGMMCNGNAGFGTTSPVNKVDISGGICVGAGFAGLVGSHAPTNGALIQGNILIGATGPNTYNIVEARNTINLSASAQSYGSFIDNTTLNISSSTSAGSFNITPSIMISSGSTFNYAGMSYSPIIKFGSGGGSAIIAGIQINAVSSTGPSSSVSGYGLLINDMVPNNTSYTGYTTNSIYAAYISAPTFGTGKFTVAPALYADNITSGSYATVGYDIGYSSLLQPQFPNSVWAEGSLQLGTQSNYIVLASATGTSTYTMYLPAMSGPNTYVLTSDGTGNTYWSNPLSSVSGVSKIMGTANQVIASAPTGPVTLSLPQSIANFSNVEFGYLAINNATGNFAQVIISQATGAVDGLCMTGTTQAVTTTQNAIYIGTTFSPTNNTTLNMVGINNTPSFIAPGATTITGAYCDYINPVVSSNIGIIGQLCGQYIAAGSSSAGTINSSCALFVNTLTAGTTGYTAIFNGANPVVGIGTLAPQATLDVNGVVRHSGEVPVSETVTNTGALSTTLDSIIDTTTNGSYTVTLGTPAFTNQKKLVKLKTRWSDPATVSCQAAGGGAFNLTSDEPQRNLRYNGSCWIVEDVLSRYIPDSFYVTALQTASLIGTGYDGSNQGYAVSLSSDGNTLATGGPNDNTGVGAVWIFTRSGSSWTQQGTKLIGTGYTVGGFVIFQGNSVSLSADGNTLAIGGPIDNSYIGATWIFTRSGGAWTQQGTKLVGTGGTGSTVEQGTSVALSADGNTLAVGGPQDNSGAGAVWIFTRSAGTWTQQGTKLIGTGFSSMAIQGTSVALNASGNLLAFGAPGDNSYTGGVIIFTQSQGAWTQQGTKIIGTGGTGSTISQGSAVALSASGNTLAIGGTGDNPGVAAIGATWIFTQNNGIWAQQGAKLVGTGYTNNPDGSHQGGYLALTADGNSLAVGGVNDNTFEGGVWLFTSTGGVWSQQGTKIVPSTQAGQPKAGAVALSSNGNTLAIGVSGLATGIGSTYIYT